MNTSRRAVLQAAVAGSVGLGLAIPSTAAASQTDSGDGPRIGILLYEGFALLDAAGPAEVLGRLPSATVHMIGQRRGEVRTDTADVGVTVDKTLGQAKRLDVLLVPGGRGHMDVPDGVLNWITEVHETTLWTTSVCTGSMLLGTVGLLKGKRATTYWSAAETLAGQGATYVPERYVRDGKIITAAGVSAGQDLAFYLSGLLTDEDTGKALELGVEYDPHPPFGTGNAQQADAELKERALRLMNESVE